MPEWVNLEKKLGDVTTRWYSDVPLHYYFPKGVKNSVAVQCKEMSLEILAFLSVSYTPLTLFMCSTPPAQRFFLYYNQLLPCKEYTTFQSMINTK